MVPNLIISMIFDSDSSEYYLCTDFHDDMMTLSKGMEGG